jgi:5-methylcytosine-specific restriction endonuclease McrA
MYSRFKVKPECGTKSGYDWHRRDAKEDPCEPCRDAMKLYWVEMRSRRGREITLMRKEREKNNTYMIEARSRRARKGRALRNGVDHDGYTKFDVLDNYGTDCYLCKKPIDLDAPRRAGMPGWEKGLQIDHVYPIMRGGSDTLDNVRPTHGLCNNRKNATIIEF